MISAYQPSNSRPSRCAKVQDLKASRFLRIRREENEDAVAALRRTVAKLSAARLQNGGPSRFAESFFLNSLGVGWCLI